MRLWELGTRGTGRLKWSQVSRHVDQPFQRSNYRSWCRREQVETEILCKNLHQAGAMDEAFRPAKSALFVSQNVNFKFRVRMIG